MIRRRHIYTALFCLYILAVCFLCFTRGEQLPDVPSTWFGLPADKVAHFIMFLPYTPLAYLTFAPEKGNIWRKIAVIMISATIGFGLAVATERIQGILAVATERIQGILGYRAEDALDIFSDSIGLGAGTAITVITATVQHMRRL